MIAGGWTFVVAAYVVTLGGLAALAITVAVRARAWAKRARELDSNRAQS